MVISFIAAIGKNNELGKGNTLVWDMPTDLQYFRDKTKGHTVIMGRKTFESIGHPMPERQNIIITRDKNYKTEGVEVVNSLDEALELSRATLNNEEIFIIGGAEIYRQAMDVADRLYVTHIDAEDKGADTFFPEIIPVVWNEISHDERKKDENNPYDYTFSVYERF